MAAELLVHAAIFVLPSMVVLTIVTTPRVVGGLARRGRAHGGPVPRGRPVERIAVDLRHARHALATLEPEASRFHRAEAYERYDTVLVEACHAADVPCDALDETAGIDRDIARLLLEDELIAQGLIPR